MGTTNRVSWIVFVILAITVGLYPLVYLLAKEPFGLLTSKSDELLSNVFWNIGFYGHILFGGLALLVGWSQFSKRLRDKKLDRHRTIGKIYIVSALISAVCGIYIGFYATGGIVASAGFISLGIIWIITTTMAYYAVRKGDLGLHRGSMIFSYAACFAAVTLRIWMPILILIYGDFESAYRLVAWLCWIPNMIFAYLWVRKRGLNIG